MLLDHTPLGVEALAWPDCLYIKMLPLSLCLKVLFAYLGLICYHSSAGSSKGSVSYVANLESIVVSHVRMATFIGSHYLLMISFEASYQKQLIYQRRQTSLPMV